VVVNRTGLENNFDTGTCMPIAAAMGDYLKTSKTSSKGQQLDNISSCASFHNHTLSAPQRNVQGKITSSGRIAAT
jgi:hypothetical protein